MNAGAQLAFFFLFSLGPQPWAGSAYIQAESPSSVRPLWKHPSKHAHRYVSAAILDSLTLASEGSPQLRLLKR